MSRAKKRSAETSEKGSLSRRALVAAKKTAGAKKVAAVRKPPALPAKKVTGEPALPTALAERAEARRAAKIARLGKEAREDVALIRRLTARIEEDFYEIGEALVRLKRSGVAEASVERASASFVRRI